MKKYRIIARIQETPDVISLRLVDSETGKVPKFVAGQCVTILFSDLDVPSGKAYSLSSAPHDNFLQITVKKIGAYSSRIHALKVGDEILISEPYGFLNPQFEKVPFVMIAGGVGIAPILPIIRDTFKKDPRREIELWFGNKTRADIVFKEILDDLAGRYEQFRIKHFLTREKNLPHRFLSGRINVKEILSTKKYDPETFFFICGREDFVGEMWRNLVDSGIPESKIATETFF